MILIPNYLISILTIPGLFLHVFLHQFICKVLGVSVLEMKYFDFKNKVGYVIHEKSENVKFNVIITFFPYLIMTLLSFLLFIPLILITASSSNSIIIIFVFILTFWFFVSFLFHALPSGLDLGSIVNYFKERSKPDSEPFLGAPYISYVSWLGLVNVYFGLILIQRIAELF